MVKHYVEFHFADNSVSKVTVPERDLKYFEIPEGAVKFRFFDTAVFTPRGIAAVNSIPIEGKPFNYSEFYLV